LIFSSFLFTGAFQISSFPFLTENYVLFGEAYLTSDFRFLLSAAFCSFLSASSRSFSSFSLYSAAYYIEFKMLISTLMVP